MSEATNDPNHPKDPNEPEALTAANEAHELPVEPEATSSDVPDPVVAESADTTEPAELQLDHEPQPQPEPAALAPESPESIDEHPSPAPEASVPSPQVETQAVQPTPVAAEPVQPVEDPDEAVLRESRRRTRRSFVVGAAAAAAGVGFYKWLDHQPTSQLQPELLHDAFHANATLSRTLTQEHILAPTYPLSRAENLRTNGIFGLKRSLKPESWRLQVVGAQSGIQPGAQHPRYVPDVTAWEYQYTESASNEDEGHDTKVDPKMNSAARMSPAEMMDKTVEDENHTGRKPRGLEQSGESDSTLPVHTPGLLLTLDDVLKLPRHELVTQFKCIEGWSQIVHWAGVRLADFLEAYPPAPIDGKEPKYVYMETPDGDYYNGYDLLSCRHPQALLVTEMMGQPLTQFHGAPLRLHMPSKYGYKQIKRIALISYTNDKPDDYWTKLGYDWYGGL